jgi:hypothetical protein
MVNFGFALAMSPVHAASEDGMGFVAEPDPALRYSTAGTSASRFVMSINYRAYLHGDD